MATVAAQTLMIPEPGAPDIDVVVVSYRSGSTLAECLERLVASTAVDGIVVVDNASEDDSVRIAEGFRARDARVRVVPHENNPGFGSACNLGARQGSATWIAFVNPDCFVEPDSLERLRSHLAAASSEGLIGADLVDAEGRRDAAARRRDPTLARMLAGRGERVGIAVPREPERNVQVVDAVSGALMLVPRDLFIRIGGFDERYRLHVEDLDLCRRVRAAGGAVMVANDVTVVHARGVSSRSRPLFVEWHKHRGLWRYFRKFEGLAVGPARNVLAFAAIFLHLALAAPRAWLRSLRHRP